MSFVLARVTGLLALAWLLCVGCTAAGEQRARTDEHVERIRRELVPHTHDKGKKVEVFWTKPGGEGPHPAVLFIHGHQEQIRDGGAAYVRTGRLRAMASRGFVAASVSQPGYGDSDGLPDFCGPFTQEAVLDAIDFLRGQAFVNPDKVAIYGYSRGAVVASMVATRDPRLAAVVLGGGAYDFFTWYPTPLRGIDDNIRSEAGTSPASFRARSALYHADAIKAPVLILHGAADERVPVRQAEAFAEKLRAIGIPLRIKIFPARHAIPVNDQYAEVYPFLERYLR
jgi:dipeptidyl aminopeptidase/acylaminoacyl peptidase